MKKPLAGLLATQDYNDNWGSFHMMEAMTTWTCVLDDNSHQPFRFADDADEYLTLRRGTLWNDTYNRFMLLTRAFVNGFGWALHWDGDLIPSLALFKKIRTMTEVADDLRVVDLVRVPLRDCWGDVAKYRRDGVWAAKTYPLLQRVWLEVTGVTLPNPNNRLHVSPCDQSQPVREMCWTEPGVAVYHFGSFSEHQRQARVEKYAREDGHNAFQPDYKYLADETGLELASTPAEDSVFIKNWSQYRMFL